jgi:hypothetical protein
MKGKNLEYQTKTASGRLAAFYRSWLSFGDIRDRKANPAGRCADIVLYRFCRRRFFSLVHPGKIEVICQ